MILIAAPAIIFFTTFDHDQRKIAFTMATGIGIKAMQLEIDAKAIHNQILEISEIAFLKNVYGCLVKGARLTIVLKQSANLMEHYLLKSGEDFQIGKNIFTKNKKVQLKMAELLTKANHDHDTLGHFENTYKTEIFYMPDRSSADSVFVLYYGKVVLHPENTLDNPVVYKWRAEVPWTWPSYLSHTKKYGTPHAESSPIPNIQSLIRGKKYALHLDNGLGEFLTHIDLAKSFFAYAEWDELP